MRPLVAGVLAVFTVVPATQRAEPLDFSGIDAFWVVARDLQLDRDPDAASWNSLFATPGYAALEAREHRRGAIENAMRFAFMPSRAAKRDSVIRAGGFTARSMQHLVGLTAARDSVSAFRATIARSNVVEAARRDVAAFLPARLADSVPPPPVAFLFFLDDGRGYPAIIVADLLRLARTGIDTGYFAHEFFHFYRRHFANPAPPTAPLDAGLAELLGYPTEEGVADQLDKRRYVDATNAAFAELMRRPGQSSYASEYRDEYRRSAEWLARVSAVLERCADTPDSANTLARTARDSLPDAGRALGAYMARAIDRLLGRRALIRAAADAYGIWLVYDDAARIARPGLPRLSPKALAVIRRLQQAR